MLRFYAAPFMATMNDLGRAIRALDDLEEHSYPAMFAVADALRYLERDLPGLPLSPVLKGQFRRLQEAASNAKTTPQKMRTLLYEFEASLHDDLKQHSYFLIPESRRALFDQPDLFGPEVSEYFRDAREDIAAAGRCLALDEWTAAVFHLMRAAEVALRTLAIRLKIKNVKIKEWVRLLQDVDTALDVMRNKKRTAQRDRALQHYAQIRTEIAGFKDAWRNYIVHGHGNYGETDALSIFNAVRSLMQDLARGLSGR